MLDQLFVVLVAFGLYLLVVLPKCGPLSAQALFLYVQMLMAIGTFPQLTISRPADVVYGWLIFTALLVYMCVSGLATLSIQTGRRWTPRAATTYEMTPAMWFLLWVSVAVVLMYYATIGSSALVEGFRNSFGGGRTEDIAGLRLEAYSGSRYLFPGYVNQFKNALLPALTVVAITSWIRRGDGRRWWAITILVATAIFGLLGTGQRGHFVMFAVAVVVYLYIMNGQRLPRGTFNLVVVAGVIVLLGTIALGRSAAKLSPGAGLIESSVAAAREFVTRAFHDQQESAVQGFRYTYTQPIQNGAEWARGFMGVLPGSRGSDLSNRIYATLFGTDRGTAPPSIWGSTHHNFGPGGAIALAAILAALLVALNRLAFAADRNTLEVMGIAGLFTTFAFWASDSPMFLLNNGAVVYVWMWWWGSRWRRLHTGQTSSDLSLITRG